MDNHLDLAFDVRALIAQTEQAARRAAAQLADWADAGEHGSQIAAVLRDCEQIIRTEGEGFSAEEKQAFLDDVDALVQTLWSRAAAAPPAHPPSYWWAQGLGAFLRTAQRLITEGEDLLTLSEASQLTGASPSHLTHAIDRGQIAAVDDPVTAAERSVYAMRGYRRMLVRKDLEAWQARRLKTKERNAKATRGLGAADSLGDDTTGAARAATAPPKARVRL